MKTTILKVTIEHNGKFTEEALEELVQENLNEILELDYIEFEDFDGSITKVTVKPQ